MKNEKQHWTNGLPAGITVCDTEGIITEMNNAAGKVFEKYGGTQLIGKNVLDCHPEPSKTQLKNMLEKPALNAYTIEKNGQKKLIYQCPWYENDEFKGFVELSLPIPAEMPHFIRK